jgi:hypothetical protein
MEVYNKLPNPVGEGMNAPQVLLSPIGDGLLAIARTEASLLALLCIEYEAAHECESFKKTIAATLGVTEKYIGDMLNGKANATPRQLHAIATACSSQLFVRWFTIHFRGNNGISET